MDLYFRVMKTLKIWKRCFQTASNVAFSLFFLYLYFSWIIEVDFNAKINITFHDFDLEISKTCAPYDYVKVSDKCNKSKKWSENIGSGGDREGYCRNRTTSFTVQTRCQNARVEFRSDDSITGRGFNATYKAIRVPSKFEIYYYGVFDHVSDAPSPSSPPPPPPSVRSCPLPVLCISLPSLHSSIRPSVSLFRPFTLIPPSSLPLSVPSPFLFPFK